MNPRQAFSSALRFSLLGRFHTSEKVETRKKSVHHERFNDGQGFLSLDEGCTNSLTSERILMTGLVVS